jgi:Family of unknown function (DUF5681)
MASDDEYKVGYCKPPRKHQFKKGHRANPRGRGSKTRPGAGELFVRLHAERIAVGGSKSRSIPRIQLAISRLSAAAVAGDLDAIEALIDMRAISADGGDFKGDGVKRIIDKSNRLLKVLEFDKNRRSSRRRRK